MIAKILRFIHAKARVVVNAARRPASVTRAQHAHVKEHADCAACGATKGGQGHHIEPYHKCPEKAADPDNFITLCETVGGEECHLRAGHGGNFKCYNPDVVQDAARLLACSTPSEREAIHAEIKAKRLPDVP